MIAYFDDRKTDVDEEFGDWITEKLIKEMNRRSAQILFVDYPDGEGIPREKGYPCQRIWRHPKPSICSMKSLLKSPNQSQAVLLGV
jgi:hypothetical protein